VIGDRGRSCAASYSSASRPLACPAFDLRSSVRQGSLLRRRDLNPQPPISEGAPSLFWLVLNASCAAYSSPWGANMSIESLEEALRLADEPAQPKQAPQTPNAERAREIADALDRVMAEPREVMRPLTCAAAPPPQHDEAVAMRPARQVRNARIPVTILVAVIIAVVMMWPITNLFRSYVERPTPTIPAFDPDSGSSEARKAAQSAPAPLLTEAARTAAGDGLASLPVPNSGSLRGPLALPPGDAPPPTASPTDPDTQTPTPLGPFREQPPTTPHRLHS